MHWIATAAALAAVLLGAALAGPDDATATTTVTASAPGSAPGSVPDAGPPPAAAPDPRAARYPVDCGGTSVDVVRRAAADLDGDGRPETVAVVRCHSETGTRPSGIYVLAPPPAQGAAPRVMATLVDPGQKMSVTGFAVSGSGTVSATLLGYSDKKVPRCCPDLRRAVEWRWKGGKFALTALPVAGSV
ncbi:hypothetical protein AB0K90_33855 [Streptomyces syringium]